MSLIQLLLLFLTAFTAPAIAPWPKRGLPSNNPPNSIQNWNGPGSQVNWAYSWDSYMDPAFPRFLEFIPMLWGDGSLHTNSWVNNVNNALARGSGHIMGFNEPDACGEGQSCIGPDDAATAYRKWIMPFAGRAALGAPAISNAASGLVWLRNFLGACSGCQIDFVPIHWYDSATNFEYFYNYMEEAHQTSGGRQIWITEFSGAGTLQQQITFLQTVIPWLDAQPYIYRYSWFWCDASYTGGSLADGNGNPTELGGVYAYTRY
ncbi:uncharacterized protein LY89DRAFT_645461 [Mollisia scopiformis]|uniref:Asl1-like glycosyl hydrolase catalytic domain-containing protein n=1 Tax=Mollisia scopiformis TaxID=149040 RepID=A0A194XCB6_MOLSC|nr:uncharacterized protein LY89DRAFT_645461 [Mollisia scopiformis]KUJ17801.1 hypothetical protein LY89DRAFT_645461 [Mollisia scopiformis]